jgi:hypothetical protein
VQKNVSFDPRIGAVEVEDVIIGTNEDVVEELDDRPGTVAASEIHGIVVADRLADKVSLEDTAPSRLDALSSVNQFELRRRAGEHAVLHDERSAIERHVLHRGIAEREMVQKHRARSRANRRSNH